MAREESKMLARLDEYRRSRMYFHCKVASRRKAIEGLREILEQYDAALRSSRTRREPHGMK
jgi:hypothetical protein